VAAGFMDLLENGRGGADAEPAAAILLGNEAGEIARLGQGVDELAGIGALTVLGAPILARKAGAECADALADGGDLGRRAAGPRRCLAHGGRGCHAHLQQSRDFPRDFRAAPARDLDQATAFGRKRNSPYRRFVPSADNTGHGQALPSRMSRITTVGETRHYLRANVATLTDWKYGSRSMWERKALCERLGVDRPIIQAPMAGSSTPQLAAAVSNAGGLGSLGLGTSVTADADQQIATFKSLSNRSLNANFFCHAEPGDLAGA